jgi:hypothetical protein
MPFIRRQPFVVRCSVLGLAFIAACGRPADGRKLIPTSGRVTLDGKLLEGAIVTFVPKSANAVAASATTDAMGRYNLLTPGASRPGIAPGDYAVTLIKMETRQLVTAEQAVAAAKMTSAGLSMPPPTTESIQILPPKYRDPDESGFTATISEQERKSVDFDVKSR